MREDLRIVYGANHRPFVVPAYDASKPQTIQTYHSNVR